MDYKQNILDNLDTDTVIKDLCEDYEPGSNISCLFADTRHEAGHDNSKSMSISPKGQVFCHACGYRASSVIGLIEDLFGKTYKQACRYVVNKYIEPLVSSTEVKACNAKLLRDKYTLLKLKELRGLSDATIKKYMIGLHNNKIVIPVRNEYGYYCNLRLYDLLGQSNIKIMSFKKGYGHGKLFPYSAFDIPGTIYLFEGEMDTLLARQLGLNGVTSTTGAANWNKNWDNFFKGRDVVIVPDIDKAGLEGCEKRVKSLSKVAKSISVVKLPVKNGKDFTDYIIKDGHTIEEFRQLPLEHRDISSKGKEPELEERGKFKVAPSELAHLNNAEIAYDEMRERGGFFKDQSNKLFFARNSGQAFPITNRNQNFLSELCDINPIINPATTTGKFVIQHIINRAQIDSATTKSSSWTTFDNNSIYLYGGKGQIIKASNGSLGLMKNALNPDNILLESPDNIGAVHITKTKEAKAISLLQDKVYKNLALSNENRFLLICWALGIFFKDLVKVKPLMRLSASTAFGKSTASKLLTNLFYGEDFLQHASTTASIYTMARQYPLLVFDNIETRNMTPDFEDFLLIAATGGTKSKRQLATDTGFILETSNCLVLTNGIEPFSKNEIISRTIDLPLDIDKYGAKGHFDELNVMKGIQDNRDAILTGILKLLSNKVVSRILKGDIYKIAKTFGTHSKERFNEYYGLMTIILDAIWPYMPLHGYSPKVLVEYWLNAQTSVNNRQSSTTNEVLYFFETLASKHKTLLDLELKISKEGNVLTIVGTTRSLLSDFRILAKHLGIKCPWQNEYQLGTRILDSKATLEKNGWTREMKLRNGRRVYVFTKKEKERSK